MQLVDLLVPPTHIPLPDGVAITEFDKSKLNRLVVGIVLSFKRKRVWQSQSGTAARKPIEVVSVILQTAPEEVIRIYTPIGFGAVAGQLTQMHIREERFDGTSAMFADAGGPVTPEDDDA